MEAIEKYVIDKVREKRLAIKMSQADLAFRLNVSHGTIGKIESDKFPNKYNLKHINQLAKIFACSPKDFLPQDPFETPS